MRIATNHSVPKRKTGSASREDQAGFARYKKIFLPILPLAILSILFLLLLEPS